MIGFFGLFAGAFIAFFGLATEQGILIGGIVTATSVVFGSFEVIYAARADTKKAELLARIEEAKLEQLRLQGETPQPSKETAAKSTIPPQAQTVPA